MDIDQIASGLQSQVGSWLNDEDESSRGVIATRDDIEKLPISLAAKRGALKALEGAEKDIRRSRQRAAADAIAAALRPLGVVLVAQAPPKRQRKAKARTEPEAPQTEEPRAPRTQASSEDEAASVGESKGGGLLGLGRRAV